MQWMLVKIFPGVMLGNIGGAITNIHALFKVTGKHTKQRECAMLGPYIDILFFFHDELGLCLVSMSMLGGPKIN